MSILLASCKALRVQQILPHIPPMMAPRAPGTPKSSKMKCDSNPCIIMGDNNKTGVALWEKSIPILQGKIEKTCIFGKKRG